MTVNYDREQFRQYLQDSGAVDALSRVLMKLYELKNNRPNAAVVFIRDHLADDLPSFTEFENLRKSLIEMETVLEALKAGGKLTKSQLAVIDSISANKQGQGSLRSLISARESEIMKGNTSKRTSENESRIRKLSKTAADYHTTITNAINSLLNDTNCNSLLKTHLTNELYDKLKTVTTSHKSSLVDCISSGLDIHESMIGVYAADSEAYDIFGDLFNPLIKDYHIGFEKPAKHPDKNWGDPKTFTDIDPNNEYITSTRIRCIRTVDGYPFIPLMNEQQFSDLCTKIEEVLTTGNVSGTWYGLEKMDSTTKRDMINNRYILEYGDRFLESAGATEFWPVGRAVFINDSKTFFIWVNEEDHLRFISMEAGSNISSIYQQLIDAVDECEQKLNYAKHEHFGFLTLCPSNLGNTIRASVMIKVPKLAAAQGKLQEIATQFNLEIRGNHGHDLSNSDTFEVSNKRKLGLTEYDSIKELYDGVKQIIDEERTL